jgi:DNA-binding MarR family transcriptional regulator
MPVSGDDREQPASLYDLAGVDPYGELVDASGLTSDDIEEIDAIMAAMGRLRAVEQRMSAQSQHTLELNETDLRAVQFLIVADNRGQVVTAGDLARHLGITTASTTKMLHRMERAGHVRREPHPGDRRSVAIVLSPASRRRAIETVGRQHAGRFAPAAALTPTEREAVRRFLVETADALEERLDNTANISPPTKVVRR